MGTRSMIAVENPYNKTVRAVYCHWDGYLEHNGRLLYEHYNSSPLAQNLIALGDISSLKETIGVKHAFSQLDTTMPEAEYEALYGNMTTYYERDREEKNCGFRNFNTLAEARKHYDHMGAEYYYVFRYNKADDYQTGEWFYKKYSEASWKKLKNAVAKLEVETA